MNFLTTVLPIAFAAFVPTASATAAPSVPVSDAPEEVKRIEITLAKSDERGYLIESDGENDGDVRPDRSRSGDKRRVPPRKDSSRESADGTESAESRYFEMKKKLDEDFALMFELKEKLDAVQNGLSSKWEEYYALSREYNRRLQKIISSWAVESQYD